MAKQRPSVHKRQREHMKRQREIRKAEKAALKRERRLNNARQDSEVPPNETDVALDAQTETENRAPVE